jgi:hypothetical protein
MRNLKVLSLFLLCLFVLAQGSSLQIYYISGSPSTISNPVFASLRGGKMIYIKVTGHSPMASGNQIYVGLFPCIIPSDGVSDTFIACETTNTGSDTDINNLPVTIISSGTSFTTRGYPNSIYFRTWETPSLVELFPASGFSNSKINFYGIHRITNLGDGQRDMGDVTRIRLGRDVCSRFDIQQAPISAHQYAYINCSQSPLMEGGRYNVTQQVVPGFADHHTFLRRSSFIKGEYFEYAALPTVSAISTHIGNNGGQKLSITGTGFSKNKLNNSVSVDGNPCEVGYSDEGNIQCIIAPKNNTLSSKLTSSSASQVNGYFSGAGLNYARYSYRGSISALVDAVRSNNSTALGTPL